MASDLKRVSGLWLKDGKNGKFMSGAVEDAIPAGAKLLIFKNDRKERDQQPDYQLFVAPADGDGQRSSRRTEQPRSSRPAPRAPAPTPVASAPPQTYDQSETPL